LRHASKKAQRDTAEQAPLLGPALWARHRHRDMALPPLPPPLMRSLGASSRNDLTPHMTLGNQKTAWRMPSGRD
jgi:hypothetical protein